MKYDTFTTALDLINIYNYILMFAIILYWIGYKNHNQDIKDCLEHSRLEYFKCENNQELNIAVLARPFIEAELFLCFSVIFILCPRILSVQEIQDLLLLMSYDFVMTRHTRTY